MTSIRKATAGDREQVWQIISQVISRGDSFVFYPGSSREKMLAYWFGDGKQVYVALDGEEIVGTFFLRENQPDLGSHIANAGYMVSDQASGKGVGKAMGLFSIEEARRLGYKAMQFNFVISSNLPAVNLWKKLGFEIIGEIPDAFVHQVNGYTNAYIMYRIL